MAPWNGPNKKGNWRTAGSIPYVWYVVSEGFLGVIMCQRHPVTEQEPLYLIMLLNHTPTLGGHRLYTHLPLCQPGYVQPYFAQ